MRLARLAPLLVLAGVMACESKRDPYVPIDRGDASYSFDGPASADTAVADRASSSTLSDGRVVIGQRPVFDWYSRDSYQVDVPTARLVHSLTFIRSDGAVVVTGCSGLATPSELASFEAVATDLATVEALKQTTPCAMGAVGDDVTVTYVGFDSLKHSASCDPQLRMLTEAGAALVLAVCTRAGDGGTDAAGDAP